MNNGHVQIDDADIATIVSVLTASPVFAKHRGSLLFDAFKGVLPAGKVADVINRTRDYAPKAFFDYVQKTVFLPNGKPAGLQFLSTLCSETSPKEPNYDILTGIINKYSSKPEQPVDV